MGLDVGNCAEDGSSCNAKRPVTPSTGLRTVSQLKAAVGRGFRAPFSGDATRQREDLGGARGFSPWGEAQDLC